MGKGKFIDDNDWTKFNEVSDEISSIVSNLRIQQVANPNYVFLVGVDDSEESVDCDGVEMVSNSRGNVILELLSKIKGNVLGIIVGNSISDMTISQFVKKAGSVLSKKFIYIQKSNTTTAKLLRDIIPNKKKIGENNADGTNKTSQ